MNQACLIHYKHCCTGSLPRLPVQQSKVVSRYQLHPVMSLLVFHEEEVHQLIT